MSEATIRNNPTSLTKLAGLLVDVPITRYTIVSMFSGCGGMDLGFLGGFPFQDVSISMEHGV
ncbi:MAG: hypothetical protein OXF73_05750 [Gammaproteobacteria bacterium]|nr:hypothetical protein [Gammaproteobacteria bacterium]MCY4227980.1 hypothetical protein [Gammaproteobacteria bacterium]